MGCRSANKKIIYFRKLKRLSKCISHLGINVRHNRIRISCWKYLMNQLESVLGFFLWCCAGKLLATSRVVPHLKILPPSWSNICRHAYNYFLMISIESIRSEFDSCWNCCLAQLLTFRLSQIRKRRIEDLSFFFFCRRNSIELKRSNCPASFCEIG